MGIAERAAGQRQAYGAHLADRFWLREQRGHAMRTLKRGVLAVTELKSDIPTPERTQSIGYDDAYLVALQLRGVPDHELWQDSRPVAVEAFEAQNISFYDLRRDPVAFVRRPYHCLQFYLPRSVLDEVARQNGYRFHGELACLYGVGQNDPAIRHLGMALLPALERGEAIDGLFLDHVLQAVAAHVAGTYADAGPAVHRASGGLAAWQERRVKEMIEGNLASDISLKQLAEACGLSVSHFARAFRQSTKISAHGWLRERRIVRALSLLAKTDTALSEIAIACGFADQSHFTRAFGKSVGASPGQWRRENAPKR